MDVYPVIDGKKFHTKWERCELKVVGERKEYEHVNKDISLHRELGVVTESWSPLGRGRVLADPEVGRVAAGLGVSPAQVVIQWHQ